MRLVLLGLVVFSLLLFGCTQSASPGPSPAGTASVVASASPQASPAVSVDPSVYSDVDASGQEFESVDQDGRDIKETGDIGTTDFDRLD